jgi:molybdopterin-guanine dinucleotide biosynthesis protein A
MQHSLSLIINAGGESRRMGQPKVLLPMPGDGQSLLKAILTRLAPLVTGEVIVVINETRLIEALNLSPAVRRVADYYANGGPLGGIASGLRVCCGWAMMVACDMPLVNPKIFDLLATRMVEQNRDTTRRWQAIVPCVAGIAQPFHALIHRDALPAIEKRVAAGERRAASFLGDVPTCWVTEDELRPLDPELHSFVNVNTPEEWAAVRRLL